MSVNVHQVVAELIEIERSGFASDAVEACLRAARVEPGSLGPYLHFDSSHYTRNLIYRTECFELLAICWEVGQAAPIHDHDDQRCWAKVQLGTLRFTSFSLFSSVPLVLRQAAPSVVGPVGYIDALPGIHGVANDQSSRERAVSLHLYAKPFAECTVYDLARGEQRRRQLGYDYFPPRLSEPGA